MLDVITKASPPERAAFEAELARESGVVRRAFQTFIQAVKDVATQNVIGQLMVDGDLTGLLAVITSYLDTFADVIPEVFERAARREVERLSEPGLIGIRRLSLNFNPGNADAAEIISEARLNLIRGFTETQREAVRGAIADSIRQGEGPAAAARRFRDVVGLTPNQIRAVDSYQAALERGSTDALSRALRDRRFDATVTTATEPDSPPLTGQQIERMVARYRSNMVRMRAETIARTETIRTLSQARQASWAQVADQLDVDPDEVERTWIATLDSKTRDTHAEMNRQSVKGLDTPFVSPSGEELLYPGDPDASGEETIACRCTLVVKFPIVKKGLYKAVWDESQHPRDDHGRFATSAVNEDEHLWDKIKEADRKLDGEEARAVSSWVGGGPDAAAEGKLFGNFSYQQLEDRRDARPAEVQTCSGPFAREVWR